MRPYIFRLTGFSLTPGAFAVAGLSSMQQTFALQRSVSRLPGVCEFRFATSISVFQSKRLQESQVESFLRKPKQGTRCTVSSFISFYFSYHLRQAGIHCRRSAS
jgi:hypothetical protein